MQENLVEQLDDLQRRVSRLEKHVGIEAPPVAGVRTIAPRKILPLKHSIPVPPPIPIAAKVEPRVEAEPSVPIPSVAPPSARENFLEVVAAAKREEAQAREAVKPKIIPYRPAVVAEKIPAVGLEQLIGLKWAGWVGAIVLVIGAGIGIKYAYDIGMLGAVPPAARLGLMSLAGFGLIAAGEWVFRKVNRISATGLFGAGVATLFLVSYAGHGYYGLYQRDTAFILMAISTLVGAAVALRGNLVSIAVLSLIGGNLAPIVLHGDAVHVPAFAGYLLMLQIVALTLAYVKADAKWWILRGISLATTALWLTTAILPAAGGSIFAASLFTLLYAGLYQAEVIASSLADKQRASEGNVAFSLLITAGVTAAVLWIFKNYNPLVRATWVIGFSAICGAIAAMLRLERLRELRNGFAVQCAALIVLAVPVALSGMSVCVAWAALALAFAAVGVASGSKLPRMAACVCAALAVVKLIFWADTSPEAREIWIAFASQQIPAWAVIAGVLAGAWHSIAVFLPMRVRVETEKQTWQFASAAMSAWASTMLFTSIIGSLTPFAATMTLVAYGWLLAAGDRVIPRLGLLIQSCVVLLLATAKWAVIDTLAARLNPAWAPPTYLPILNPLIGSALVIAGTLAGIYWLRRDALQALTRRIKADAPNPAIVVGLIVILTMTFAFSLEIDRLVMQSSGSAWPLGQLRQMSWTISSLAFIAIYTHCRGASAKTIAAWILPVLLAMKFVIIDTLPWETSAALPLVNTQVATAIVVAGAFIASKFLLRRAHAEESNEDFTIRINFLATCVLLWAGTMEIDRLVSGGTLALFAGWPAWQLKHLLWSALWTCGVGGFIAIMSRMDRARIPASHALQSLMILPVIAAMKFLILDTGFWRAAHRPVAAMMFMNVQFASGLIVVSGLLLVWRLLSKPSQIRIAAAALATILVLWITTLEIDRVFEASSLSRSFADPQLAKQVTLSIFWSLFAIAAIVAGFSVRAAGLRYFGLALFALTLVKVFLVDLSGASAGYRFLSFMGLGLLMIGTSVVYGKVSPKLQEAPAQSQ